MNEGPDELGEKQAVRLGGFMLNSVPRPDFVIASPYLRARRGAEMAAAIAWPGMVVVIDDRLIEQNKGTDEGDYYEDDNLMDRPYPGGQTLRQVGHHVLDLLHDPDYADAHIVVVTHARLMLANRVTTGRQDYLALRDQGLPNGIHGIMIGNCDVDTYDRPDPASPWFTEMRVRQTWGDNPLDSGLIPIPQE
ncbi:MAG TPA: histidine phosphatase family protein [Candidatus Saccharimonadales bacterium]|nr:histidine phosphatase family protein [Candidatus Saccharimonadales bacterium]